MIKDPVTVLLAGGVVLMTIILLALLTKPSMIERLSAGDRTYTGSRPSP